MNSQIIYYAGIIYFVAILIELIYTNIKQQNSYDWKDTALSIWYGFAGAFLDLSMKGTCYFVLNTIQQKSPIVISALHENTLLFWILLFVVQDFCFYWLHRVEHRSRIFWAVHSSHHSSPNYNFAVALRSSVLQPLYRFIFYIPAALIGFDGFSIMMMYAINQFYQFWLHTEIIGKLPKWVEFVFVTPSHHKVHHASNPEYIDKNIGQVLIIWDRMFGTFKDESKLIKARFGLVGKVASRHPLRSIFNEFIHLYKDMQQEKSFKEKVKLMVYPPEWKSEMKKTS